ncbi:MAG: LysR family transcriptional regulator [Pseudomonadota bacterium]
MNLHNIEAFLAVGETGSFTAAAKRLDKTQSAVSQAVRQLEIELGATLVNRTSRTVTFTPAGDLLRGHAARLVEDMKKMAAMVREQSGTRISQLRMGLVDSFASAVGPTLIRSMLTESLNLSLWSDVTPRLGKALFEKRADIIVCNDAFSEESNLTRYELLREPYVLLLPPDVPWDVRAPELARLSRAYPMIRYEGVSLMGATIEAQCYRLNVTPTRRVSVDSTEKLIAAVLAGVGWSISTPMSLLRARENYGAIRVVPFPGETFYRSLFMVSRRGELDELVQRLARLSCEVLAGLARGELGRRHPELADQVQVTDAGTGQELPGEGADQLSARLMSDPSIA